MLDAETLRAQARSYRASAAVAPNRRIFELLLELAAEFQNAATRVEAAAQPDRDADKKPRA